MPPFRFHPCNGRDYVNDALCIREEMFNRPPKVLLFHEKNEDDMRDGMILLLKQRLDENHIEYTSDLNDIETVQLTIAFINKSFIRNCSHHLDRFIQERYRSSTWNTAVFYENHESELVPKLFDMKTEHLVFSPEAPGEGLIVMVNRVAKLIAPFIGSISFKKALVPFSKNWDDIEKAMGAFSSRVVNTLNTFALDFSKIDPVLLNYTFGLSYSLYNEVVPKLKEPTLIAIFEGCRGNCCQLTTISKLLWTVVYNRSFGQFIISLYLSKSHQSHDKPSSLVDCYNSELVSKYHYDPDNSLLSRSTFFIVIDGLENFLSKEDDPAIVLANFVSKFDRGSLIIVTSAKDITSAFSNHPTIEMQKLGPVQGTKCTSPSSATSQRPALFTVLYSQLKELVLEPEIFESDSDDTEESVNKMDVETDDEMQTPGEDNEKNVHLIDFDESEANTPKKPRASSGESVHRDSMSGPY